MCYKTMRCADFKHLGAQLSSLFQRPSERLFYNDTRMFSQLRFAKPMNHRFEQRRRNGEVNVPVAARSLRFTARSSTAPIIHVSVGGRRVFRVRQIPGWWIHLDAEPFHFCIRVGKHGTQRKAKSLPRSESTL